MVFSTGKKKRYQKNSLIERRWHTVMMQTLKIEIYKPSKNDPETRIKIPLSTLTISEKIIPRKVRASLEREGIDLHELSSLHAKQGPKGTLIEVETASERIVLSIE